ncbi:MAG TPA: hypothetical protein DD727_07995 [Clostridiales bacterium]|nr:hypothetical protein [Clostridiales bacterium]
MEMNEKLLKEKLIAGDEEKLEVSYFLTMREEEGKTSYGIEIQRRYLEPGHEPLEIREIQDVTCDREQAEEILCCLSRNTVTPCGLEDALDVILGGDVM